jgi:DNA-binding NarL/FixJ family response regulator
VRVAVVSSLPIVRAGLTAVLVQRPELVEVVDVAAQDGHLGSLDVVLYDLHALDHGGDDELRHLVRANGAVIGVGPAHRTDLQLRCRQVGAAEMLPLSATSELVLQTVLRHGARGEPPSYPARSRGKAWPAGLTDQEMVVLVGITAGRTNQQIADDLFLSINTVKGHVRSAYRKVGATSRSQAVAWGYAHGLAGLDAEDLVGDRAV